MIKIIVSILSFVFVVVTILPLVRSDYWTFRSMEYPRLQKLCIGFVIVVLQLVFLRESEYFWWMFLPVVTGIVFLLVKIFPYTSFSPVEMKVISAADEKAQVKILTANVLEPNSQYDKLLNLIDAKDPDIVFLVETDHTWNNAMQVLDHKFPYSLKNPLDNTYGLLFFSRLKLRDEKIIFRVEEDVPSVEAEVQLPSGTWVKV
jgi:endonuclease/exonuclease/phosphatase (EEP) superfamily protein YafD